MKFHFTFYTRNFLWPSRACASFIFLFSLAQDTGLSTQFTFCTKSAALYKR